MEVRDWSRMLKERLRQTLIDQAQTGNPTTYKDRLGPPDANALLRPDQPVG